MAGLVGQIVRILARLVQIPIERAKFIGLCRNLKGTSDAINKIRLDLAVTVSAVISQEYVFQESQVTPVFSPPLFSPEIPDSHTFRLF